MQGNKIDNEAVLQLQVTKGQNQFLSTLAEPGLAQFLTFLKPCSILLPHVHQRANEFYSVFFGARQRFLFRSIVVLLTAASASAFHHVCIMHSAFTWQYLSAHDQVRFHSTPTSDDHAFVQG